LQTKEQVVLVNTRASGACKHKSERCLVYVCVCQVASHDSKVLAQTLEKEHSQLRDLSVKYRWQRAQQPWIRNSPELPSLGRRSPANSLLVKACWCRLTWTSWN